MKFTLEEARRRAGLSQGQLADKSEVPQTTISGIENSGKTPNVITAAKLAHAMGLSTDDLITKEVAK